MWQHNMFLVHVNVCDFANIMFIVVQILKVKIIFENFDVMALFAWRVTY